MLTRRDLLKYGVTAATLSGFSPRFARGDDGGGATSPFKTKPFVQELPFPLVKSPFSTGSGCVDKSTIWGYDGTYPGPTFKSRYGTPILVRIFNGLYDSPKANPAFLKALPPPGTNFGNAQITTHLHNGHTASESDGYPGNFHDSGTYWDNHYPNILNGFSQDPQTTDSGECMNTLWYHDHRLDFTAQNVYAGLAGFYLLFDDEDCGDETNTNGFQLPSGEFDVPMVLGDKLFDADGQAVFDFFNLDGILGDKFTVNGAIQPFLNVKPRKYRFRILDAGPSRFYALALSDGTPLIQISSDGNLLSAPILRPVVTIAVSERHDVIVDFSKYQAGDKVYLMNRAEQTDGRGPTENLLTPGDPLVEFRVTPFDKTDVSRIPSTLRIPPPIRLDQVVTTRFWEFNRGNGQWTVNGKIFREEEIRAHVKCNTREIWRFKNGGGGWSHPIHTHYEESRTLTRNGRPPAAFEADRKDVSVLGPGEETEVLFNFRDFHGKYVTHCHNVVHEDHAMMIRFDIEP